MRLTERTARVTSLFASSLAGLEGDRLQRALAQRIRAARNGSGLSVAQAAFLSGLSEKEWISLEHRGIAEPVDLVHVMTALKLDGFALHSLWSPTLRLLYGLMPQSTSQEYLEALRQAGLLQQVDHHLYRLARGAQERFLGVEIPPARVPWWRRLFPRRAGAEEQRTA